MNKVEDLPQLFSVHHYYYFIHCSVMFDRQSNASSEPQCSLQALFSSPKILQNFLDSPSHRIFRRMHGVLNIDENKN